MTAAVVRPFDGTSASDRDGLVALFESCNSTCFCRYWHFDGDKNAWLARCAFSADESEAELRDHSARGSDEARGVIATAGASIVGWMKVAPVGSVRKLYDQRFYRGLASVSGDKTGVFAVGCALVHPEHRGRGVAHALAKGAVDAARAWGAVALEAFPRLVDGRVTDEELWMGPHGAYAAAGLVVVEDTRPYPVLRANLR